MKLTPKEVVFSFLFCLHAHHAVLKPPEPGMCLPGHQQVAPNAGRLVVASPDVAHYADLIVYVGLMLIWCDCVSLATKSDKWFLQV